MSVSTVAVIWWALAWRQFICTIGAMIVSGFVGFAIGVVGQLFNTDLDFLRIVGLSLGVTIGIGFSVFPVLWLCKGFGKYRLTLVPKNS